MKQILCFGDSNTYGLIPGTKDRYDWDTRWSGTDRAAAVGGWLPHCRGRTVRTDDGFDDPLRDGRRGTELLSVILETHKPVDVVVLMLGTNDCKTMYDTSAEVIGRGVERLLDQIRSSTPDSKILLMSPIALGEGVGEAGYDPEFDESSVAVSKRLPEVYRRIAHERGISFLAASAYAKPSEEDREHMNEEGHAALAEAVYAKLKEMLAGEKENAQIPA